MGVPAFYRWLTEKYPKIVSDVLEKRKQYINGLEIPIDLTEANPNGVEYDNLYVDMNGLIHPCSHPEDREGPTSEAEMYVNVMKYVDRLFAAVRPRRVLFLAIDGVAPRAKMNQQRARRFRAAQDAKDRQKMLDDVLSEINELGMSAPSKQGAWDSNVITPGTEFMYKLSLYLRFYILERMNSNPAWRNIKVILSDANEPGEGEHKIMKFIRSQRRQPGYDPNQHHVIHGLDADLIMLALSTHEPHFTILRELVTFGGKVASQGQQLLDAHNKDKPCSGKAHNPEDEWIYAKPLQSLQISTLREYLQGEFAELSSTIPFQYDFERTIDDFVFLCFFVGNDFLPHLPSLDIRDGAIDFLLACYRNLLPSLGDYLTSPGGIVNLTQVDVLLAKVGEIEDIVFRRRKEADEEQLRRRRQQTNSKVQEEYLPPQRAVEAMNSPPLIDATVSRNHAAANRLRESFLGKRSLGESAETDSLHSAIVSVPSVAHAIQQGHSAHQDVETEIKRRIKAKEDLIIEEYRKSVTDSIRLHESGWKSRYYDDPPKRDDLIQGGGLDRMCRTYVEGLCWVLKYYYEGCPSWNWFYPFHYAPFASDLLNIDKFAINFELAAPFQPVEQLIAVLPSESVHALPRPCQWLMTDERSPIFDIYVSDAPLDPNGKHLPWLWVLLLPFIDEERIRASFKLCFDEMNLEDIRRNSLSVPLIFVSRSSRIASTVQDAGLVYSPGTETDSVVIKALRREIASESDLVDSPIERQQYPFDPISGNGICGCISLPSPQNYAPLDRVISCPSNPPGKFKDIASNQIMCFSYQFPEEGPYESVLLRGFVEAPRVLNQFDLIPRRPPRLNKGRFNLMELAQQNSTSQPHRHNLKSHVRDDRSFRGSAGYEIGSTPFGTSSFDARAKYSESSRPVHHHFENQSAYPRAERDHVFRGPPPPPPPLLSMPSPAMPMFAFSSQNQQPQPQRNLPTMQAMRHQLALTLQHQHERK